jgi:hypothetical protein
MEIRCSKFVFGNIFFQNLDQSCDSLVQIEAYETDRAQRKVKRHRNIFAQGMQYDISESHKKDTEMAEGISGNGETVEEMSGDSSESDSDDDKEINEDTKANRELGRNIQKPPKDSLFEGGASKWYDAQQSNSCIALQ